jgi:1-deoxy-D-xylulose 5-phosphate reductoisomerase
LIAADDVAVDRFLAGTLSFTGIAELCAHAVKKFGDGAAPDLPELLALDTEVRAWAATATPAGASRN